MIASFGGHGLLATGSECPAVRVEDEWSGAYVTRITAQVINYITATLRMFCFNRTRFVIFLLTLTIFSVAVDLSENSDRLYSVISSENCEMGFALRRLVANAFVFGVACLCFASFWSRDVQELG